MKSIILYRSQYGSTKQYASWIQEELSSEGVSSQCDSFDNLGKYDMRDYDVVLVGEGVYAGNFKTPKNLIPIMEKYPEKRYIFFIVGIADMENQENRTKLYNDLAKAMGPAIEKTKVFFLRGALDYSKLNFKHGAMMWMLVKYLKRKPEEDLPEDADKLIDTYGGKVSFLDKYSIKPLIRCAKEGLSE
jgi:menaquinone-dependent protoporphyrinogen IX oxidase